jgi:hypothetical protein
MIGAVNTCAGGPRLARHLADADANESVAVTRVQGLVAQSIPSALAELERLARGARTTQPLVHAIASPQRELSPAQWDDYWAEIEIEFGLTAQPFVEVEHRKVGKGGRVASHRHRVYLRILADRRAIPISHPAPRTEKVCRITEFEVGEPAVSGCFNRAVIDALRRDGRHDVADHLAALGLDRAKRPVAASSRERQQAERRRDLAPDEVWARAWRAWLRSPDGPSLLESLQQEQLIVAAGEKGPILVAPGGSVTALRRAISAGASRAGAAKPRKKDIIDKLGSLELPTLDEVLPNLPATFDPGICGHTGDTRRPPPELPPTGHEDREQEQPADTNAETIEPEPELRPLVLTAAQQAAVHHFMEMVAGGAARAAKAARDQAIAEAKAKLDEIQQAEAARRRIDAQLARAAAALDDWETPTIGLPNWRNRYRAELAGLPEELGSRIRWVERHASITVVHLVSRERVETSPVRATSTGMSWAATAVMVAHAKRMAWSPVRISGGTAEWRAQAARRMVRAGLTVWNPELQEIAAEEAAAVNRAKKLIARWKWARQLRFEEPDDQRAHRDFIAMLSLMRQAPLARTLLPRRERITLDCDLDRLELRERLLEGTGIPIHEYEAYATRWMDDDARSRLDADAADALRL